MNFDRKSIERLISLNDAELSQIIREIAAEAGVDTSGVILGSAELIDGFLKFERLGSLLKNLNLGGANVLQEK